MSSVTPIPPSPLTALRDAAKVGIADIEAGNFRSFDSPEALARYLAELTAKAID